MNEVKKLRPVREVKKVQPSKYCDIIFENAVTGLPYKVFLEKAVSHFIYGRYILFKLFNKRTKKYYVGYIESWIREDKNVHITDLNCLHLINHSNNDLKMDAKHFGMGEITCEIIGTFSSIDEVTHYKNFLLNQLLDKGYGIYNNDIYNGSLLRYIIVYTDIKLANKVIAYCVKKKLFVSDLIVKLLKKVFKC